jgi:hypothetical protein
MGAQDGADAFVTEALQGELAHVIRGAGPAPQATPRRRAHLHARLDVQALPLLADHTIAEAPVLPVAWALGWALGSAAALWPGALRVEGLQVLRGIRLPPSGEVDVELILEEEQGEIAASLHTPEGPAYRLRLLPGAVTAPPPPAPLGPPPAIDPAAYRAAGVITYGPLFPAPLAVLHLDDHRVALRFAGSPHPGDLVPGAFNPYAYELATHALLVWLWERRRTACLPQRTARFVSQRPLPPGLPFWVSLRLDAQREDEVVCSFDVRDEAGALYAFGEGLTMTPIPADSRLRAPT